MPVPIALAAGGHAADISGQGTSQTLLGVADIISSSARRVRFNRDLARSLARRLRELAAASSSDSDNESAAQTQRLLHYAEELFRQQEQRTYLSQILHRDRDLRDLQNLEERLDIALSVSKANGLTTTVLSIEEDNKSRDLARSLEKYSPGHPSTAARTHRLPPRPQCCFGRGAETQLLSDSVTAGGHVAILGGPGMGKTTLALAVLHCPDVTTRFGSRRFFAHCDAVSGGISCLSAVAAALDISPSPRGDLRKPLRAALSAGPALVVLDNFESAWEPADCRSDAEDLLRFLSEIHDVSVIVTLRGSERPHGLSWARPFLPVLEPLDTRAAMQLVATISGIDTVSAEHTALISAQENHPLALVLLANLAQAEPADALIIRWHVQKTAMLRRGAGADRWTCLDVALETSLSSPRMQAAPEARALLGLISLLPCGALGADISVWGAALGNKSLSALIRNGLAYRIDADRVRVLAPIRNYVLSYHPPAVEHVILLSTHYFTLAEGLAGPSTHADSAGLVDLDNIACVIRYALRNTISVDAAIQATLALCTIFVRTGSGAGPDLLSEALRVSREQGMQKLEADLLCRWAKIAFLTHRQGHPAALLRDARIVYERIGDASGAFDASLELLGYLPPQEAITEALKLLDDAAACADAGRLAACQFKLAKACAGVGNFSDAILWHEKTIRLLLSASEVDDAAVAMNLQYLADVFLGMGDFSTALVKLGDALSYGERLGDVQACAITHSVLGWVYCDQGHFHKAITHYTHAAAAFGPGSARNTSNCHLYLARAHLAVGDEDAALAAIGRAERLCVAEGDVPVHNVPILRAMAEYALFRGDLDEARAALSIARTECRRAGADDPPAVRVLAETEVLELLAAVERRSGNDSAAISCIILAATVHRRFRCSPAVVRCLAALAELLDDETSLGLIAAIIPPLERFGFALILGNVLLHAARIAERRGRRDVARRRAARALLRANETKNARLAKEVEDYMAALETLEITDIPLC